MVPLRTQSRLILIALLAAASSHLSAADIGISAEISSAAIAFEEKDTLRVSLHWQGEPFAYQIDDFPMPSLEKLQILGSSSSVSSSADSAAGGVAVTTRTYTYILAPTDYGTGIIEPLNLTATNRTSGEAHDLRTGRLTIEIARPVPKPEAEGGGSALIIVLVALVVIFGGGTALFILIRRKQARSAVVAVDGHYVEALQAIKREAVADRKLFYSRLYRLLLNFLEKERGLDMAGKTGEEVIEAVGTIADESERAHLIRWLKQAQTIKYQPESPSPGDVENSFTEIREFFEDKHHDR
jgi:hypothetical protein